MDFSSLVNATETVNTVQSNEMVNFTIGYVEQLPRLVMGGDLAAIVLAMIAVYVAIVFINKLTHYLIGVVKNLMILTIIGSAFYTIVTKFIERTQETMDPTFVALGVIAIAIGFVAVLIAIYFLFLQAKKKPLRRKARKEVPVPAPAPREPISMKELLSFKKTFKGVKEGRHTLTTMLTYILIAEFGVFSSVTISAPSVEVGIGLFVLFVLGVTVYTFRTYSHPVENLKILFVAMVAGFLLSLILGHFWASIPLETILSLKYFEEATLVAFLTGIALSLFMAGREKQEE